MIQVEIRIVMLSEPKHLGISLRKAPTAEILRFAQNDIEGIVATVIVLISDFSLPTSDLKVIRNS